MSSDTTFALPAARGYAPARELRLRIRLRRRRDGEPVRRVAAASGEPREATRPTAALTAMTRGF